MILLLYYYIRISLKSKLCKNFFCNAMSEENSFFWLFFLEKNKMTYKNLKRQKKFFAQKTK